jgi:hypothetical protein
MLLHLSATAHTALLRLPAEVPNPGDGSAPPGFENFETIMGWGKWIALGVLVMALIFAGVMMAIGQRRGEGGEHAGRLGWVLGGVLIVSAAFSIVGFLV